jgi:hypothetical protein
LLQKPIAFLIYKTYIWTSSTNVNKSLYRSGEDLRISGAETPIFPDIQHIKVVIFAALGTARLYTAKNIIGTHFF